MGLFKSKEQKALEKLLNERNKQDKKVNKLLDDRMKIKYTSKFLKENKNHLTENAMKIDDTEYKKIVDDLKNRLNK